MIQSRQQVDTQESNQSLWLLIASPTIWAAHFGASYLTAAIWCAKFSGPDRSLGNVRVIIAIYTAFALLAILYIAVIGYRRNRYQLKTRALDRDTPEDRHRFLGFATLLLSAMSAIATLFVALAALIIEKCH